MFLPHQQICGCLLWGNRGREGEKGGERKRGKETEGEGEEDRYSNSLLRYAEIY